MISNFLSRRDFSARLATLFPGLGLAGTALGTAGGRRGAGSARNDEISHTAESIHQEVVLKASRKRVYGALTETKQFDKVVQLSAVMQTGVSLGNKATDISREVGGAFILFGGHIVGRHIELVPHERIVQAWRVGDWEPGLYSIARFELKEEGSETKLVFDHTGFPNGKGEHLAAGWRANYWEPLAQYLAQSQ